VRPGFAWLLGFLALPAAGAPLLVHPAFRRFGLPCRAALAAGVGAVVLSLVMTLAALAGVAWGILWLVAVSMAVSALLRLAPGNESGDPEAPDPGHRFPRRISVTISGLSAAAALYATLTASATSADLFLFWGPKAQAFAAARTVDATFLRAPLHAYMHPDYPPLVTNVFAFATMLAGRFPWGAATLSFPLVTAGLALALPGLLGAGRPRDPAFAVSALIIAATSLLGIALNVAGNGDTILLFFEVCSAALLTAPDAGRGSRRLLAGIFLAGAASAKVEGLAFVAAAAALFLLLERRGRTLRGTSLLLLPTVVSLLLWFAFGAKTGLFGFYEGYGSFFTLHWESLPLILRTLAGELFSVAWALPFLLPIAVLLATPRRSRSAWIPLGSALLLSAFFVFTYLHSNYLLVEWIGWSAGRIYTPVAALLALAAMPTTATERSVPRETARPARAPGGA
jgi:hypothetical protein